jgi:hypothetical protein
LSLAGSWLDDESRVRRVTPKTGDRKSDKLILVAMHERCFLSECKRIVGFHRDLQIVTPSLGASRTCEPSAHRAQATHHS